MERHFTTRVCFFLFEVVIRPSGSPCRDVSRVFAMKQIMRKILVVERHAAVRTVEGKQWSEVCHVVQKDPLGELILLR